MSKYILAIFGILDFISFIRTYKIGISRIDNIEHFPIMFMFEILLIISLLASGLFSIMNKKISLIIYYIQIPLRIAFMILTFGFLLEIFGLQYDSLGYKIIVAITFLLEITRLIFTIVIHRRKFRTQSMPAHNNV